MICKEEGVSTSRFCGLFEIPERTWRRWQAKARQASRVKGPWPQPVRDEVRLVVGEHALQHPVWGHRRIWALARHDGYRVVRRRCCALCGMRSCSSRLGVSVSVASS